MYQRFSFGSNVACNCDDERTGLTDDNVLMSKDQLPVTGKVLKLKTPYYGVRSMTRVIHDLRRYIDDKTFQSIVFWWFVLEYQLVELCSGSNEVFWQATNISI